MITSDTHSCKKLVGNWFLIFRPDKDASDFVVIPSLIEANPHFHEIAKIRGFAIDFFFNWIYHSNFLTEFYGFVNGFCPNNLWQIHQFIPKFSLKETSYRICLSRWIFNFSCFFLHSIRVPLVLALPILQRNLKFDITPKIRLNWEEIFSKFRELFVRRILTQILL